MACLHRKYLMDCDQFDQLWQRGKGRCELCGRTPEEANQDRLDIDHDGGLGRWAVRGLLCRRCNTKLHVPSVVEPERAEEYHRTAWYHSLGPVMPEPPVGTGLNARWGSGWTRNDAGWHGKFPKPWLWVTQAAGPYLMAREEYLATPSEHPPSRWPTPPRGSACARETKRLQALSGIED